MPHVAIIIGLGSVAMARNHMHPIRHTYGDSRLYGGVHGAMWAIGRVLCGGCAATPQWEGGEVRR